MRTEMAQPAVGALRHWSLRGQGISRAQWIRNAALLVLGSALGGWVFFGKRPSRLAPEANAVALIPTIRQPSTCVMRLHGANTVGTKMAPALVQEYLKKTGARNVRIVNGATFVERRVEFLPADSDLPSHVEVFGHGSKTAFAGLASASCDVGMSSSPISEEDVARLESLGQGNMRTPACEQVVGLDGLAILVHPSNTVAELLLSQVFDVFTGKIRNWEDLGRRQVGAIRLYARDEASGTYECFKSLVLCGQPLTSHTERFEDSVALSDRVALDTDGIGFVGVPFVRNCRAVAIGDQGTPSLLPTRFTIATEDYLLSRRLYFYHSATLNHLFARDFVEFVLSDEGQQVVNDAGFIKQSVELQKVIIPEAAPADYHALASGAERLSLSLRFTSQQNRLDTKGERDLERIFTALGRPRFNGHSLSLVGFIHKGQSEESDVEASFTLVQAVAREFKARGVQPDGLQGFGSALALASNQTEAGRSKNRRVEVWLKKVNV